MLALGRGTVIPVFIFFSVQQTAINNKFPYDFVRRYLLTLATRWRLWGPTQVFYYHVMFHSGLVCREACFYREIQMSQSCLQPPEGAAYKHSCCFGRLDVAFRGRTVCVYYFLGEILRLIFFFIMLCICVTSPDGSTRRPKVLLRAAADSRGPTGLFFPDCVKAF